MAPVERQAMRDPGSRRRQTIALVLSGIFPGLGQFYNRQHVKGVVFLVGGVILSWLLGRVAPADALALIQPKGNVLVVLAAFLVLWVWSVIDAWRAAGR